MATTRRLWYGTALSTYLTVNRFFSVKSPINECRRKKYLSVSLENLKNYANNVCAKYRNVSAKPDSTYSKYWAVIEFSWLVIPTQTEGLHDQIKQGTEAENKAWESKSSHHDIIQINKAVKTTNYLHWHENSNFLLLNCNSKSWVQSAVNFIKNSSLLSQFTTFLYGLLSKALRNLD